MTIYFIKIGDAWLNVAAIESVENSPTAGGCLVRTVSGAEHVDHTDNAETITSRIVANA